jgi:hypothetical protein
MPVVRYDPPKKPGGGILNAVKGVVRFYTDPVGTILHAATDKQPKEDKAIYGTLPIEVDTETGKVTAITVDKFAGKATYSVNLRNTQGRQAAAALEQTYATGELPQSLPPGYRATAQMIADLHHSNPIEVAEDLPPAQDQPGDSQWGYDMGGFLPPGGLAGFSQMMGVSKLALTRGSRGKSVRSGKRRRKRTKTAKPRKRKAAKRSKARLVKGSAAAKRYMASIRRKRK